MSWGLDGDTSLETLYIPATFTNFWSVFGNDGPPVSLKNVYYGGTLEQWFNIDWRNYEVSGPGSSGGTGESNPLWNADNFYLNWTEKFEETTLEIPSSVTELASLSMCG